MRNICLQEKGDVLGSCLYGGYVSGAETESWSSYWNVCLCLTMIYYGARGICVCERESGGWM